MYDNKELCQRIVENVRASFADFSLKREQALDDSDFVKRTIKESKWQAELCRFFAFLPTNSSGISSKKYVFLSARHSPLVSRFRPEEAALVGGPKDRSLAISTKIPFFFTGDLLSAASNILFRTRIVPVNWVIERWLRIFTRQQDPCFLVVPNDTLPIALLLVKIAEQCKNVTIVCVQHGLFNSGLGFDDIDGRNSAINLVYCEAQRREMERRLPGAIVEVMGLPGEFHAKAADPSQASTAILVGTGTYEDMTGYKTALGVFGRVRPILERAGFQVEYRPHLTEQGISVGKDAFRMNHDSKQALLDGTRKVFVGFNSTLLFEAHLAGHLVIILDDISLPGYCISEFGIRLHTAELDTIAELIRSRADQSMEPDNQLELRERFEQALMRAMDRLEQRKIDRELK